VKIKEIIVAIKKKINPKDKETKKKGLHHSKLFMD